MPSRSSRWRRASTQFVLAACDYVENPWGDYDELNLGFLVRPVGGAGRRIGSFVYRMPVNQAFTCEAGNRVMGFPKTVEDLDVHYTDEHRLVPLRLDGQHAVTLTVPRAAPSARPSASRRRAYSYLDGAALRHDPVDGHGHRLVVDPADVVLELGDGTGRRRAAPASACPRRAGHRAPGAKASAPPSSSASRCSAPPGRGSGGVDDGAASSPARWVAGVDASAPVATQLADRRHRVGVGEEARRRRSRCRDRWRRPPTTTPRGRCRWGR